MPIYAPNPVDTSKVKLPSEIMDLAEELAKNNHNVWAAARFNEGWLYGPRRDDNLRQHPCLVPYDCLPESEKEYDRRTVLETLKTIVAMGFEIRRKD